MKSSRGTRVAAALLVLVLVCVPQAFGAPKAPGGIQATVSGAVTCTDGLPVSGASVEVGLLGRTGTYDPVATLTTGLGGTWSYGGKAGTYRFVVTAPDADPHTAYLVMVNKGVYTLDVTLQGYGTISGAARDAGTGALLPGASVEFFKRNGDGSWPTAAAASVVANDGTYASPALPCGAYAIKVSATGYGSLFYDSAEDIGAATPVVVARSDAIVNTDVSLPSLPMTGTISGHVYASTGAPMYAYVTFYRQNPDGSWPTPTFAWDVVTVDVAYTSGELPLGNYKVRFFATHTGSQYWAYAPSIDLATPILLSEPGQAVSGIDGHF